MPAQRRRSETRRQRPPAGGPPPGHGRPPSLGARFRAFRVTRMNTEVETAPLTIRVNPCRSSSTRVHPGQQRYPEPAHRGLRRRPVSGVKNGGCPCRNSCQWPPPGNALIPGKKIVNDSNPAAMGGWVAIGIFYSLPRRSPAKGLILGRPKELVRFLLLFRQNNGLWRPLQPRRKQNEPWEKQRECKTDTRGSEGSRGKSFVASCAGPIGPRQEPIYGRRAGEGRLGLGPQDRPQAPVTFDRREWC